MPFNFLSYIQTRYPCATKNLQGSQIPKYDGFCLDINSLIFVNIYSNKESFSNEEMARIITDHLDFLFRSVNPTKFVFIAFDGILPNAKINYLQNKLLAMKDSICNLNEDNSFPNASRKKFDESYFMEGTPFINELFSHLKDFIAYKISTDCKWQKIKIFMNGPEIPGESKVKIAQFIRYYKSLNNTQTTKYCLYTFDPELLLLGLSTHEPYVSIIKDKMSYLETKDSAVPEQTDFSITHLSVIREFLKDEYALLFVGKLKFEYDFEKLLDDWILIGILISTYSLPSFLHLNAENGALPLIFKSYLKVLRKLDGYINEFGQLVVSRLQELMVRLSKIEMKLFESDNCEILNPKNIKQKVKSIDVNNLFSKAEMKKEQENEKNKVPLPTVSTKIRNEYYKKFAMQSSSDFGFVPTMVSEYVKSIQWHLKYYYQECCSWSWKYSFSQAPLISDMNDISDIDFNFESEKTVSTSAIPQNIVMNKEQGSNAKKKIHLFVHSELKVPSPTEKEKSSFENHANLRFIKLEDLTVPKEVVLKNSTKDQVMLNNDMSGFPLFDHISYKLHFQLKKEGDCDDPSSVNEVAVLEIPFQICNNSFEAVAAKVLGRLFFVNWPYIEEAYVYSITNLKTEIALKTLFKNCNENMVHNHLSLNEIKSLKETAKNLKKIYDSMGICIGEVTLLLKVYLKIGDCYIYEPRDKIRSQFIYDFQTVIIPYQLLGRRIERSEIRYEFVHNVFSTSTLCFMIGHPHYGSLGEIIGATSRSEQLSVRLSVADESKDYFKELFKTNKLYDYKILKYLDAGNVAKMLGLRTFVLHTICQSVFVIEKTTENGTVKEKRHDVGLKLKCPTNSQEQTLAYAIKIDSFWYFSKLAIELIRNYIGEFPEIIEMIEKKSNAKEYVASECFKNAAVSLKKVDKWLRGTRETIAKVQEDIKKFVLDNVNVLDEIVSKKTPPNKEIDIDVSPEVLFKPGTTSGLVAPDRRARHDLLDRIICVRKNFTVPFGLKGTIINIISSNISTKLYNIYEVMFDSPFSGSLTLYGSAKCKCYRLTVADFINISYGKRNNKSDTNDKKNKEKIKMKKSIKLVNKNVQKKEDKKLVQSKKEGKLPKFARKNANTDFSVN